MNFLTRLRGLQAPIALDEPLRLADGGGGGGGGGAVSQILGAQWVSSSPGSILLLPTNAVIGIAGIAGNVKEVAIYGAGGTGSCAVDVWKRATGGIPTSGNDITGGTPPAIVAGTVHDDSTLTGWTTAVALGDVFLFTLASTSTFTNVSIFLRIG